MKPLFQNPQKPPAPPLLPPRIEFTIPGPPKGKARAQWVRTNSGHMFTPKKTEVYENLVKVIYLQKYPIRGDYAGPIELEVYAYFPIPKGTSKKKIYLMDTGMLRPVGKPDYDNIIKIISDSLNGAAYRDDKQIVTGAIWKYYSTNPHVLVRVKYNVEGSTNETDRRGS